MRPDVTACAHRSFIQIPTAIATSWVGLFLIKSAHFGVFAHHRQSSTTYSRLAVDVSLLFDHRPHRRRFWRNDGGYAEYALVRKDFSFSGACWFGRFTRP